MASETVTIETIAGGRTRMQLGSQVAIIRMGDLNPRWELYSVDFSGLEIFQRYATGRDAELLHLLRTGVVK